MSEPYGNPVGLCEVCDELATEDVDAQVVDGDLIHDDCLVDAYGPAETMASRFGPDPRSD